MQNIGWKCRRKGRVSYKPLRLIGTQGYRETKMKCSAIEFHVVTGLCGTLTNME